MTEQTVSSVFQAQLHDVGAAAPRAGDREPAGSWRQAWPVLLILLAGVVVRLTLWLWLPPVGIHDDEVDYHTLATNLAEHGAYLDSYGKQSSLRPPLYPFVVAGVYRVFGLESFQAVRLVQVILSLVTGLVVYRLGTEVYERRVGLWAFGLYCFYPSLLGFNNLLYTEVLFTLLLCTVCYLVVRFLQREAVLYLAAVGLFLGLAALTRSVVWLFPPVLCLFLLGAWKVAFRRRLLAATVFLLAFAVTIAPWSIRNSRLEQTFVAIDTMGGRNFMMGNYEYTPEYRAWDAVRWQSGEHWTRSWRYEVNQTYPPAERDTEGKLDKLAMRQGFKYVLAHPGRTLKRDLIKFFDFWGLERELVAGASRGYFGTASTPVLLLLTAVIFGSYAFVILAGIFSMVVVPPADKRIHGFLLLLLVFICGMHTLVFGHSRYHLPLIPLILVYAAAALVHARAVWQARQHWSFWLAGGLCAILVGAWVWDITVVELERFTHMVGFGG